MNSLQQESQAIQDGSKTLLERNNALLDSIDNLQKTSKKLKDKAEKQSRYLFAFTVVTVIFVGESLRETGLNYHLRLVQGSLLVCNLILCHSKSRLSPGRGRQLEPESDWRRVR